MSRSTIHINRSTKLVKNTTYQIPIIDIKRKHNKQRNKLHNNSVNGGGFKRKTRTQKAGSSSYKETTHSSSNKRITSMNLSHGSSKVSKQLKQAFQDQPLDEVEIEDRDNRKTIRDMISYLIARDQRYQKHTEDDNYIQTDSLIFNTNKKTTDYFRFSKEFGFGNSRPNNYRVPSRV